MILNQNLNLNEVCHLAKLVYHREDGSFPLGETKTDSNCRTMFQEEQVKGEKGQLGNDEGSCSANWTCIDIPTDILLHRWPPEACYKTLLVLMGACQSKAKQGQTHGQVGRNWGQAGSHLLPVLVLIPQVL